MEPQLESYIQAHRLITKQQNLLLAISGGIDSVVMAHLFHSLGYTIGFAHCNFNLRGEDSNDDADFVKQLAEQCNCVFHTISFDTKLYAKENKLSIEMAARNLRYEWFETIMKEYSYDLLATAHHKEDNAETFLLNIIRGTGIKGLLGIHPKQGNIIRPMLCFDKKTIVAYAHKHTIAYRIDKSNFETDFKRNKIRNTIYPVLQEINPAITQTINENIERLSVTYLFYEKHISETIQAIVKVEHDCSKIVIADIIDLEYKSLLLYEWLAPYSFTEDTIQQICSILHTQSGKRFLSDNYLLLKDRTELILSEINKDFEELEIKTIDDFGKCSFIKEIELIESDDISFKSEDKHTEHFDFGKIQFPITVRAWKKGDSMIPFGMKGKKKLSDIFIDLKIPVHLKKTIPILVDKNGNILWIVGYKTSNKTKIIATTKKVLKITIH